MAPTNSPIRLDFEALPLVEAAVRVTLQPPLAVTFDFVNQLRERLGPRFSTLTEPEVFEQPPGLAGPITINSRILGAVFSGNDQGLVVSLNPYLLAVRWAKRPGDTPPYPRFPVLRDLLREVLGHVRELQPSVLPSIVNMLYVNIIQPESDQGLLRHYFTEQVRTKAMEAGLPLELVLCWREKENQDVRFELKQVQIQKATTKRKSYRLATAAGAFLANEDTDKALIAIHARLQVLFRDSLSEEAKTEWSLTEVTLD